MQSLVLALALALSLLASTALTHPNLQPRQSAPDPAYLPSPAQSAPDSSPQTNALPSNPSSAAAQFSSAAAQLISLYIPPTLAVPFGIAMQSAASAASVSGDINSIVESALTAATPPPFLSALPTVYSSNLIGLESAISALRGAASTGVSGAARVTTGTDSSGGTFTSTVPAQTGGAVVVTTTTDSRGSTVVSTQVGSGAVLVLTLSNSLGSTYVSSTTVAVPTSGSSASASTSTTTVAAVLVTTTDSAGATVTSTQSASSSASSSTPPPSSSSAPPPSSSSRSALAAPTQIPLAAAGAGVLGLVGLLAAF